MGAIVHGSGQCTYSKVIIPLPGDWLSTIVLPVAFPDPSPHYCLFSRIGSISATVGKFSHWQL